MNSQNRTTIMDIQNVLNAQNGHIRKQYKAEIKGIFGSYAGGNSDINDAMNFLVEFDAGANLFHAIALKRFLKETFGCEVNAVSRTQLRKEVEESILKETIPL